MILIASLLVGALLVCAVIVTMRHINQVGFDVQTGNSLIDSAKKLEGKSLQVNSEVQHEEPIINNAENQPETRNESTIIKGLAGNKGKTILPTNMQKQMQEDVLNKKDAAVYKRVLSSINLACGYMNSYYEKNDYKGFLDWTAIAMLSAGENIPDVNLKKALAWKEKDIKEGNDFDSARATDYQRTLLGILSVSGNPRSFGGINFVDAVKNSQMPDGKFADSIEGKGNRLINAHVWGIIAIYSAGEKIPQAEKAYKWLVSKQNADGGFGILAGGKSDLDMTGMALTAFGALGKNNNDVNVRKAIEYIRSKQSTSGGFEVFGQENPETACTIIQGLISVGVEPVSKDWIKENNQSIVDSILSFQLSDGAFEHVHGGGNDIITTTKVLTALADYYYGETVFERMRENP